MEKISKRNNYLLDNRLSMKAKGIISFGLSTTRDHCTFSYLLKYCKDGKDGLRTGLNDLILLGYCRVKQSRNLDGTFTKIIYEFNEEVVL
jgi:hypothetical protein